MDNCTIKFSDIDKVNSIIKELCYDNVADCYRLAALINTEAFKEFCKNDSVAKSDDIANINKNVLRRLIKEYRNNNTFSVKNNSKVSADSGMYDFKSLEVYNDALTYVADLASIFWYAKKEELSKSGNAVNTLKGGLKKQLRIQLIKRLNAYGAKFDAKTSLEELYTYAEQDNIKEQDKNFADLVRSANGDISFWHAAFNNSKIANIGLDLTEDDQKEKEDLMADDDEDIITDADLADEVDLSTRQWAFGTVNNYTKHVSEEVKQYLNNLPKLSSTTKTSKGEYDYDKSNSLGVTKFHTYQECIIELTSVIGNNGWKSIKDFIEGIRQLANNKPEFAGFIKLADDMEKNTDFANAVMKDLNKYNIDALEITVNPFGNIDSVQSNTANNPLRQLYFNLRNDLKGSSIQLNHFDIDAEIANIKDKFNKYKINIAKRTGKGSGLLQALGVNINFDKENIKDFDEIVNSIKAIYRSYFPSINDIVIDRFIIQNGNNKNDNITILISNLESINKSASTSLSEYEDRNFNIQKVRRENYQKRKYAIETRQDINTIKFVEEPTYTTDYLIGAEEALGKLASLLYKYTPSKAELNFRNTDGNLQSGVIYNNYITNICKILSDPKTLTSWIKEKMQSNEYAFSNILIDRPEQGIKGIARQKENGEYVLTEYAASIINTYLLNGVSNQQTGINAAYTNMSDGDYFLTGLYAFLKPTKTYKLYNENITSVIETAPYIMRTPSDAPKNFAITLPKYSYNGLYNWDKNTLNSLIQKEFNNYDKEYTANNIETIGITYNNQVVSMSKEELANFTVNIPTSLRIDTKKAFISGDKVKIAIETTDNYGIGYIWFEGKLEKSGSASYITEINYLGKQTNVQGSYGTFNVELKKSLANNIKNSHTELRSINRSHPIFNSFLNILKGEIYEYLEAKEYTNRVTDKSKWIEWYHYNPKTGKRSEGNAFKFLKLDPIVGVNVQEEVEHILIDASSTGEQNLSVHSIGELAKNSLKLPANVEQQLANVIEKWIVAYEQYFINNSRNRFGQYLEQISDIDLAEYGLNDYIANVSFDDLFEGNSKYYKDAQTFLKRAKEVQAGGTSYNGVDYNVTDTNSNPFTQSITPIIGEEIIIPNGNKEPRRLQMRRGWNAIVIHNTNRASSVSDILYNKLIESGTSKEKAKELASAYGYSPVEDGENNATTTKTNDAQSYITIYEAARRIKLMGEYPKYAKLIEQLTDDTTDVNIINPAELKAFIQVMKNFYYDQYYDENLHRHVSRQIKNAEFVLVPKFLEGTSLGVLANIMIENDIDQVNTQETSKAVNYNVLDFWDNEGNMIADVDTFTKRAIETKMPYSYMYLYRQQEVPQHIEDAKNKAGIQVMKKVLDNLYYASSSVKDYKNNFINAYITNIKEDFDSLMEKYGITFDSKGHIVSTNRKRIDYKKVYRLAQTEAARLGLDSNMLDYLTVKNKNAGPVMPSFMNLVSNKIESIAQSQFNKFVTRQKLPGWHAAQVTSVGLESKIQQYKRSVGEEITDTGKRVELHYYQEDNVVEVLLPKWASSMFNQYDEDGNLIKEIRIEDVDEEVLKCIGYRIPTEGKQSMAVLKVVGFLPEWMGSTIVVPDEWVIQTGSDFDVDSIYGIAFETYLGKDGRVHKVQYIDGTSEEDTWVRYANYVNSNINKLIRQENELYLNDEEKATYREKAKRAVDELNKEESEKFPQMIKEVLANEESETWTMLSDDVKEQLNLILQDRSLKFKDRVSQIMAKLVDLKMNGYANDDAVNDMYNIYRKISNIIQAQIDFNRAAVENVRELMQGVYKDYFRRAVENRAEVGGLMTIEDFSKLSIEEQNNRKARNNRIVESMIAIMNDPAVREENLARSNFDDIEAAIKKTDKMAGVDANKYNIYNPFTQIQFRRNAMSGAMLKAFSVTRDTANSVFNVTRATLAEPFYVRYGKNVNLTIATQAFEESDGFIVHKTIGNSKNDRNVVGDYITVASSHTTAHILDAIKSGAIPNENEYTFAAFKTLFDIGMDAYSAILWIRQPGISRIVDAYFESKSIFSKGNYNPVHTAIKRIAIELGVKINNNLVTEQTNINDVITALNNQYNGEFGGPISLDYKGNRAITNIDIPRMEQRGLTDASSTGELLEDLRAVLNFDYVNTRSKVIANHARVLNPDRFGAKQTIYSTRKVIEDIQTLIDSEQANELMVGDKTLIESIYPGITAATENGVINYSLFITNKEVSSYPSLNAFLKYSTIPSIMINQGLFDTERYNFVTAIKTAGDFVSGAMDEKMYNDVKKYIIDSLYKQYSGILSPITLDNKGNIIIDYDYINSLKLENTGITPQDIEKTRIYGFGYSVNYDCNIKNINKPTKDEFKDELLEFAKLTPAQKVIFVQQRLTDTERSIFNYIKTNLYNNNEAKRNGVSQQVITFDDQQVDMEEIYKMFEQAFFNKNPLIRLTAIDLIKYAFVVEGFNFRRHNISKIIKNSALYTSIEDGGTGIVDTIKDIITQVDADTMIVDDVYYDYFRSHSNIKQIPTYKIRYNKKKPSLIPLSNSLGMYYFSLTTEKDLAKAKEVGLLQEYKTKDGNVRNKIKTHYINISNGNKTTLYKVILNKDSNNKISELYLAPLNKLEANEHGSFSSNNNNNKYPSIRYYQAIVDRKNETGQSFNELSKANDNLFTKEGIAEYRASKLKQESEVHVPTDENYLSHLSERDSAVNYLINNIKTVFDNPNNKMYWGWCGSIELKKAFNTLGAVSVQNIIDNDGIIRKYSIRRISVNKINTKRITDPIQLKGIEDAKRNGIKQLDTIYVIKPYKVEETVEANKESTDVKESSIGLNIESTELSKLGDLAQEFILDIKTQARIKSDEDAQYALADIRRYGTDENNRQSIEDNKIDTIKRASQYYASKAIEIRQRLNNFMQSPEGEPMNVIDDRVIEAIKEDENLRKDYMNLILSAVTFGETFPLLNQISDANLDNDTKRNIITIRNSIDNIKNDTMLKQAFDIIAVRIYQAESTNPIIEAGLGNVVDYVTRDASLLDKIFQDSQELSIPIVQLILRKANNLVYQRNMEARNKVLAAKKVIADIKAKAEAAGMNIDWNNIIDAETVKFRQNFTDDFYKDRTELEDEKRDAELKYGKFSKEYLLADNKLRQWLYDNTEQEYVKEYYADMLDNERKMLSSNNIDYYIEYLKLTDEQNRIWRIAKSNRSEDQIKRLREIKARIAFMRDGYDYNTGEWKPEKKFFKAQALDSFVKTKAKIGETYFTHPSRAGFERELNHYLDIIAKYKKYDINGRQIVSEDILMQQDEYANAIEWLTENTIFNVDVKAREAVNNAFAVLNNGKQIKNPQFKSIMQHIDSPYDAYGIIDGRKFTANQRKAIRDEQQAEYDKNTNDSYTGLVKLIRNASPDEQIYTKKFYDGFKDETSAARASANSSTIKEINNILVKALDEATGKINLSWLSKDELRTLNNLYSELQEANHYLSKSDKVKQFIKDNVDFNTDKAQWLIDEANAKEKDKKEKGYYNVWKTVANAQEWVDGNFIGYKNEPSSIIFGYVSPKKDKNGEIINKDFVDYNKNKAIKFINEHTRFVNTQYYYQERDTAIKEGRYEEWYKENHVYNPYTKEFEPIRIWKELEYVGFGNLTKQYFPTFSNTTTKPLDATINKKYKKGSANYNGNAKYYRADTANEYERELRQYMMDVILQLSENNHAAMKFISKGLFPRRRMQQSGTKQTVKALANFVGLASNLDPDRRVTDNIGYSYDRENNIPMIEQLKDASTKDYIKPREQGLTETDEDYAKYLDEVKKQNRNIAEHNRKVDAQLADRNYEAIFEDFIYAACDANAKSECKLDLYYLIEYLKNFYTTYKTTSWGNLSKDGRKSTEDRIAFKEIKAQRALDMIEVWSKRLLFDEYKSYTKSDRLFSVLQNVASSKFMMFNITGGISNVLTGSVNVFMERFAGEYFDHKDWENAKFSYYLPNLAGMISGMNSDSSNNVVDGIIKLMGVVDYASVNETRKSLFEGGTAGFINRLKSAAYAPQSAGEHFMQNTAMLAMMLSNRIYTHNGKTVIGDFHNYISMLEEVAMKKVLEDKPELLSLYEKHIARIKADKNELKDYMWLRKNVNTIFLRSIDNKEIGYEYNRVRKLLIDEKGKEFKNKPRLIDQFELINGFAQLKTDSPITFKELAAFKGKVVSVNKKIHGVYDKLGAATIETTTAYGSLVMQFHKYIYTGALKRWRRNGYYNESRQSIERGFYWSLWDFATTEFKDLKKRINEGRDEDGTAKFYVAVQNVAQSLINTFLNWRFNWDTMSASEKANCRRALGEIYGITLGLLGGVASLCLLMGSDDDDDVSQFIGNLALYEMDRLSSETLQFNIGGIAEFKKLWGNPVAIGTTFTDLFKSLGFITEFLIQGDEFNPMFSTGQYAKENKLSVYIRRQIPIYRSIDRLMQLDQNNKYYKLTENMMSIVPTKDIAEFIMNED